ncbi:hypothetical protein [Sphingomonas sp. CFBP 8765]|uniref:hypothetical protein n=1 Tax=Sphingomonas sp. CFBP 8765 TaxID=2775274 RepID=UPI00177DF598|nr:hypothetical protein [Sphingomonas sp. CFBP 8765]MBD8469563.1 hypothetical protein [Sphingomonas sp. CFBP 8765]
MIAFECLLARLTAQVGIPTFAMNGEEQVLRDVFDQGSAGDIQLSINNAPLNSPMSNAKGFHSLDLHLALQNLTQNVPGKPANKIAVMFADFYAPYPQALGVMFDRGFETPDDPSSAKAFRAVPREGCAVFLGAITQYRKSDAARQAEALFTTIHELGHVFNLQHANHPANFLAQSVSKPYPPESYQFLPAHRNMLAHCSSSPFVCPGGSPFQSTGMFANHNSQVRRASSPPQFGLELAIGMGQREFWPFEPIELDVTLRVANGVDRSFRVPDTLDAGYDTFAVWIEEPGGSRRRLQSPRRYCGATRSRQIRPGRPFRRDLSIFGEAGGYTFRIPGIHRLWVDFEYRHGTRLRSNDLEVNVLPADGTPSYRSVANALARRRSAGILYHRLLRRNDPHVLDELADFAVGADKPKSAGSILYAVARAKAELAIRDGEAPCRSAAEMLRRAADEPDMGEHQRELARKLTVRLDRRRRRTQTEATVAG